ncbi:MAG: tetratricopeptide repeat protein [Candidatus Aminicenantes bacterium]|nr:tetratricopeptide repeat protein [Candidatus Aminicenantes bacterium]
MNLICNTPIPLEFKNIFLNSLTGDLRVSTTKNYKQMFFKNGKLIQSDSDFFDERLGVILNLTGKVSDSQYDNISGLIHSIDDQVGTILVQNGIISKDELKEAVLYRTRRIAVSSFSIVSGNVDFTEGTFPKIRRPGYKIPVEEIIYRGGRRIESVNCIAKRYYFNSPELLPGNEKLYKLLSEEECELVEIVRSSGELSNARLISRSVIQNDKYWEGITILFLLGIIDFSPDMKDRPTEEDIIGLVRLKSILEKGATDIFSILKIKKGDSLSSIESAYLTLVQKYDPERFGSDTSSEIKKSAQFVLQKLGTAFREINESREKETISDLELDDLPDEGPEDMDSPLGEKIDDDIDYDENFDKFERGKELYHANKFDEALIPLKETTKSESPGYENYLYLGLCQTHLPFFSDEAERHLKKAVEMAPAKSEPVHALGKLYVRLNRKKSAKKCFERAVELEPGNIDAAQDLFKIKYPPKKKKKFFSREK